MKRINLLSKAEMKKVLGGVLPANSCTNDSQCSNGKWCCFGSCETPVNEPLPDLPGSPGGTIQVCPEKDPPPVKPVD